MAVLNWTDQRFDFTAQTLIVGAGACGLSAALAARDAGVDTVVLEKTKSPLGTTAMSTGLIPAAGTPEQVDAGIADTPDVFVHDIMAKNGGRADPAVVAALADSSADTVRWLRDSHGVPLSLVDGFVYPGHSHRRMFGTPNRTGAELMAALERAVRDSGADIVTEAPVADLYVDGDGCVRGVRVARPDGASEAIGCDTIVLASSGFGGNPELVAHHIPEMAGAILHTHTANKGDALLWGQALGAQLADLDAYQGHGGLAVGHGVPILWPAIMRGGFQVNADGHRFSDESEGYSEQARRVLEQPGGIAWTVFDRTIYDVMTQFDDFRDALDAGAILEAGDVDALAARIGVPDTVLCDTFAQVDAAKLGQAPDRFGRAFDDGRPLRPPLYAVKVTGVLFHTQGGLCVDTDGRVLRQDGRPFPNLFAGGGAARGISGRGATGYIAGNGLLTATSLGKLAGRAAAAQVRSTTPGGAAA